MSKKRFVVLGLGLICVIVSGWAVSAYSKREQRLARRHHLYCEFMHPGMSKAEVVQVLRQVGEVRFNGTIDPNPRDDAWFVVFLDAANNETYGGVHIEFWHGQYDLAAIRGFDTYDVICDFIAPVQTADVIPIP